MKKSKVFGIILIIIFIFSMLLSNYFISRSHFDHFLIHHHDDNLIHNDCIICEKISIFKDTSKNLTFLSFIPLIIISFKFIDIKRIIKLWKSYILNNLVSLKVKLTS